VLHITAKAYEKMMGYTMLTQYEYTAFLFAEMRDSVMTIYDISLPKQEVSSSSAEVDEKDMVEWYERLNKKHKQDFHGWVHSHNTMKVFASRDDEDTIDSLIATMPFVITIITNHYNDLYVRLDVECAGMRMTNKEIPLVICPSGKQLVYLQKEMDRLVSKKTYGNTTYQYKGPKGQAGYVPPAPSHVTPSQQVNGGAGKAVSAVTDVSAAEQETIVNTLNQGMDYREMLNPEHKAGVYRWSDDDGCVIFIEEGTVEYDELLGVYTDPDAGYLSDHDNTQLLLTNGEVGLEDDGSGLIQEGGDDKPLTPQQLRDAGVI